MLLVHLGARSVLQRCDSASMVPSRLGHGNGPYRVCIRQSVPNCTCIVLHASAASVLGSRSSAPPLLSAYAWCHGPALRASASWELKIGPPYTVWGQIGQCALLQASTEPGGVPHLQAAESEPEDEGEKLLPASGTQPAVPQRKWYRDRQILLCLAGTGLITLVSSQALLACMGALGHHCWPPAGLMWKQDACTGPLQGCNNV